MDFFFLLNASVLSFVSLLKFKTHTQELEEVKKNTCFNYSFVNIFNGDVRKTISSYDMTLNRMLFFLILEQ